MSFPTEEKHTDSIPLLSDEKQNVAIGFGAGPQDEPSSSSKKPSNVAVAVGVPVAIVSPYSSIRFFTRFPTDFIGLDTTSKICDVHLEKGFLRRIANEKNSVDEISVKDKLDSLFKSVVEESDILVKEAEKGNYFYKKLILKTTYDSDGLPEYDRLVRTYCTDWKKCCEKTGVYAFVGACSPDWSTCSTSRRMDLYMHFMW